MNTGKDEKLVEAVVSAAHEEDGRMKLSCADAFRLAAELGVQPADIGRICNGQSIRITGCQIGCFR